MTDGSELRALTDAVGEMRVGNATMIAAVDALKSAVADLKQSSVSRVEHNALKDDVADIKTGVSRNDERWSRLAWFIGLALLGAALTFLIGTGGLR